MTDATQVTIHNKSGGGDDTAAAPEAAPSQSVAKPKIGKTTDSLGRNLTVKRLSAIDRLNLFQAAGALAANERWMGLAAIAASVIEIDGDPVPKPVNVGEMKALVGRLDDEGLEAVGKVYEEVFGVRTAEEIAEQAKNL